MDYVRVDFGGSNRFQGTANLVLDERDLVMWAKDPEDDDDLLPGEDTLLKVVVTVGLTALISGLVTWGVDELRDKFGSKKPNPPFPPEPDKKPDSDKKL